LPIISDPGSHRQEIHPDILIESDDEPIPVLSCFVALQDISKDMGPTVFVPSTVSIDHQTRICNPDHADDLLRTVSSFISTLNAGDCSIYDPRMLHAGGSNQSSTRRRLLTISFVRQNGPDPSHDLNPGSIQPILKGRQLTLSDMKRAINDWRNSAAGCV
jgi:ectoine hydroxylase-related dioxygenase (phytanoyl-CoA dioxygenase family)